MSIELTLLLWSVALLGLYIGVQSTLYRLDYGVRHAGGPRDDERPPGVLAGRAERALRNFLETYPGFVALIAVIELGGLGDGLTEWGAHLYVWARIAFLPAYLSGLPYLRSAFWAVSAVGLVLMFAGALV